MDDRELAERLTRIENNQSVIEEKIDRIENLLLEPETTEEEPEEEKKVEVEERKKKK